jgi:hypothetical protein
MPGTHCFIYKALFYTFRWYSKFIFIFLQDLIDASKINLVSTCQILC